MAYNAGDTLVRAVMTSSTGLVADECINDFAFGWTGGGSPADSDYDNLFSAVSEFYRTVTSSGNAVSYYISDAINRSATHELQAYAIAAGPLGSPVYTDDWLGPSTTGNAEGLPTECAGVLSFHGDLTGVLEESGATRPRARRRGRIYVGPLNASAKYATTPPYMLTTTFMTTLNAAANIMGDAALADDWVWSVWSRANATLYPVVGGWTENAPDTLRRRGPKSSSRTAFTR